LRAGSLIGAKTQEEQSGRWNAPLRKEFLLNLFFHEGGMMGYFIGGSPYAMANQLRDGYILLNRIVLKKYSLRDLQVLKSELEKLLREVRSQQPPLEDIKAIKLRNRRMQKLISALSMIESYCAERRKL